MIGTNNPKPDIVVPVLWIVVVPGRATQIIGIVVPGAATQSAALSFAGSFPFTARTDDTYHFPTTYSSFFIHPPSILPNSAIWQLPNS